MIIALPTGIKIFSWINLLSILHIINSILHSSTFYSTAADLYIWFPRANKKYLPADTLTTTLVLFGSNLVNQHNISKLIKYLSVLFLLFQSYFNLDLLS
jgi:hypothetical protein